MNTITATTKQLFADSLRLAVNVKQPIWATVRIKKGTSQILDGRTYKTEDGMNRHRGSRPKNAVRIKILRRLNHGLIEAEMLDA